MAAFACPIDFQCFPLALLWVGDELGFAALVSTAATYLGKIGDNIGFRERDPIIGDALVQAWA
jgi:hypothetical protein